MMRFIKIFLIITLFVSLTACSRLYGDNGYISNRDRTYLKAKSTPPLVIPPGLSSSTIHEEYPVANKNYGTQTKDVSLTPPELYPEK